MAYIDKWVWVALRRFLGGFPSQGEGVCTEKPRGGKKTEEGNKENIDI